MVYLPYGFVLARCFSSEAFLNPEAGLYTPPSAIVPGKRLPSSHGILESEVSGKCTVEFKNVSQPLLGSPQSVDS